MKMFRNTFTKILFFFLFSQLLSAQEINFKEVDEYIIKLMQDWKIPGTSIAIVKDSALIYSKGYGFADLEQKKDATANTIYGIASCSKAFTTCALGILVDQQKLDWAKPRNNYMPELILNDPYITANITAIDLVTHRSGYPSHDFLWYSSSFDRKELIKRMRYLDYSKSFRSYFQYNNLMYMAAGELIEKISGKTWEVFVKENIFIPLEMKNSNFTVKDLNKYNDVASAYRFEKGELLKIDHYNADNLGGAGAINSSVNEMSNWLIMQLNKGKFKGKKVVNENTLAFIQKPATTVHTPIKYDELFYSSYALGWYVTVYRGNMMLRHAGALDGVSTLTTFMPQKGYGVIIIANLDYASSFTMAATLYIYDKLNKMEPVDWNERYLAEKTEAEKKAKESENEEDKNFVKGTSPTHKLIDYTGSYNNKAYGNIKIEEKNVQLYLTFNSITAKLIHQTYDTFKIDNEYVFDYLKLSFILDDNGNIKSVCLPLESKVNDIEFVKL
ncbi:MAG: serine hydrolase [bacterium]